MDRVAVWSVRRPRMKIRNFGRAFTGFAVASCLLIAATGTSGAGAAPLGNSTSPASNLSNPQLPQTLPPIPAGFPTHFGYGLFNGSISDMHTGVPYDFRYQYLAGGVNTGGGWQSWGSNYVLNYVSASRTAGYIPGF